MVRRMWINDACGAVALLVTAATLWARFRVPVPVGLSTYDDILFVRGATSIARGDWLGPFDHVTLAKGPAYPAFMAAMHVLGIPVKIGEQATYALACATVATGIAVITRRIVLATAAYVVLALNPVNFSWESSQLIRDSWHAALSLLFPAAVFLAVVLVFTRSRLVWVLPVSVLAGLSGAAFWLSREEGLTILPTLVIIMGGVPLLLVRRWLALPRSERLRGLSRSVMPRYGICALLIGGFFTAPIIMVQALNDSKYGVALTNDMTGGAFDRTFADWTRVAGGSTPLVPISVEQRATLYRVSPAARELEPFLESPDNGWNRAWCGGVPRCDFPGQFAIWAVRDSIATAGHFSSEPDAQEFLVRLDAEIEAGCDSGELNCTSRLLAPLQPLQRAPVNDLLRAFGGIVTGVVLSDGLFNTPVGLASDPTGSRPATIAIVDGLPHNDATAAAQLVSFASKSWPYHALNWVYQVLVPILELGALIMVVLGWRWCHWPRTALLVLAIALGAGVLVRSALLALIDVADYDATAGRYQLAGQVMMLGFAVIGAAAGVDALLRRGRRSQSGLPPPVAAVPQVGAWDDPVR